MIGTIVFWGMDTGGVLEGFGIVGVLNSDRYPSLWIVLGMDAFMSTDEAPG